MVLWVQITAAGATQFMEEHGTLTYRAYSWNVYPGGLQYGTSFFAAVFKYYPDRLVSIWWNYTQARVWALKTEGLTSTSTSTTTLFDTRWTAPSEWDAGKNTIQYASARS
jgi:hypothetical protein